MKTSLPITLPGNVTYKSKTVRSAFRGGTVILVKKALAEFIHNLDVSVGDQI